jgi:hypothetical protein
MNVNPFTPADAQADKINNIPDAIIEIVNSILSKKYSNRIVILQSDIINEALATHRISREDIFENGWMDFEPLYRNAGWNVEYAKPEFNKQFEPYFVFTIKK